MPLLIGWAMTPPTAQPHPFSAGATPPPPARFQISPTREGQYGSSRDSLWVQCLPHRSGN